MPEGIERDRGATGAEIRQSGIGLLRPSTPPVGERAAAALHVRDGPTPRAVSHFAFAEPGHAGAARTTSDSDFALLANCPSANIPAWTRLVIPISCAGQLNFGVEARCVEAGLSEAP